MIPITFLFARYLCTVLLAFLQTVRSSVAVVCSFALVLSFLIMSELKGFPLYANFARGFVARKLFSDVILGIWRFTVIVRYVLRYSY